MKRKNKWDGSDLDRKVFISTVDTVTIDANTKAETKVYSTEKEIPAYIEQLPISRERELTGGVLYDEVLRVVIRYKSEYEDTNIRLRYKGKYYDVTEARESIERRRWLILGCRIGGKQLNR
jgi:head-tail adaptor